MKDIALGLLAGIAGAAVWAGISVASGYEVGWVAWGIGACVGYAVAFGNRDGFRAPGVAGVLAVGITILSILGGKYTAVEMSMPNEEELLGSYDEWFADEEYVVSFLADEVVAELEDQGQAVVWPDGVDPDQASSQADYSPAVWQQAATRWDGMSEVDRDAFISAQRAFMEAGTSAFMEDIRRRGFLASFAVMDLLFFGLAVVSAYGIASGGNREPGPDPEVEPPPVPPV